MSKGKLFLLAVIAALGFYLLYSFYLTPQAQVKRAIIKAKDAVEKENFIGIESFFAVDFRDSFGLDKTTWLALIHRSLTDWKDLDIRLIKLEIQIDNDQAIASFHTQGEATRAETMREGQFPDRQSFAFQNISFQMVKQNGKWKLAGWSNINPSAWGLPLPEAN